MKLEITTKDSLTTIYDNKEYQNFENLNNTVQKTRDSLQKIGFFDANISRLKKENDSLYIAYINAGAKTSILRIKLRDSIVRTYAEKSNLFARENQDLFINVSDFESIMADFTAKESKNGYPLSSFQLKNTISNGDTLIADLVLKRENLRRIDKIVIEGYDKFPLAYLKHYAGFRPNNPFDRILINRKFENLTNLPFINALKDPEVLFEKDSTSLFLYVEKIAANRFDGFLGFGNSEDSGKLRLDGYLDLHLLNNLNYGELLELNYKSDGNDQQTLRVALEIPYLFKSPLGIQAELNLFRRDTSFSTSQQQLDLFYQLKGNSRISSGINLENSTSLKEILSLPNDSIADYKKTQFNIGFNQNKRSKEKLFPSKSAFFLKTSLGKRTSLGATENQIVVEGGALYTFVLNPKQRFVISNNTKNIISDQYISNELFRFGGINSIRGFKENTINANLYSVFRTEYSFLASPSLYVHTITDAAYFENELLNEQSFLYSFGIGAGIATSAGLLHINLANGLREGQNFQFSNSILHIRLTTNF
ncbi:BamA/TamA family outer membrane protein [Flavimarina sp. Hel_I_48]|uniref:BamA/TamA family outer membrane protein n=1 Tax=Flavimarina sp. Hel_I_48 TaxID=1392488 RepID=UPI0004DEDCF3|nr:BamA/TamA family outer membrane protein [Flavimarina sp. Hel_I_48]